MKKSWVQILHGAGISSSLSILKSLMKAQGPHREATQSIILKNLLLRLEANRISRKELSDKKILFESILQFLATKGAFKCQNMFSNFAQQIRFVCNSDVLVSKLSPLPKKFAFANKNFFSFGKFRTLDTNQHFCDVVTIVSKKAGLAFCPQLDQSI